MAEESVWSKLAKKGYLGTKAKITAEADGDVNPWQRPTHRCTSECSQPCPKKGKQEEG